MEPPYLRRLSGGGKNGFLLFFRLKIPPGGHVKAHLRALTPIFAGTAEKWQDKASDKTPKNSQFARQIASYKG